MTTANVAVPAARDVEEILRDRGLSPFHRKAVLVTGIAWRHLPAELGCSPATAHRRLQEWQRAGVFGRLHRELLRRLNAAGRIDWSQAVIDGSYVRALQGGARPGPPRSTVAARARSITS